MKSQFLLPATAVSLAVSLVTYKSISSAQQDVKPGPEIRKSGKPTKSVDMPAWSIPSPRLLSPPNPATTYKVEPIPVRGMVQPRTDQQGQELKNAAIIVNKVKPIPQDRIQFFSWMNSVDSPVVFTGWNAFVQSTVEVSQGRLITLRVSAFASRRDGSLVAVNNNFIEEYLWANSKLQYVRGYCCPIIGSEPIISRF